MANTLKFGTDGNWATKKGSTLAYNSENGNYKPLPFTFDRAGSATRVNKQGLIEVVSNNEPRIDFLNDSNGALLLEPSRSNLAIQSSIQNMIASSSNSGVVEFGNLNNGLVSADITVNGQRQWYFSTANIVSGTEYTVSFYVDSFDLSSSNRPIFYIPTEGTNGFSSIYGSDIVLGRNTKTFTATANGSQFRIGLGTSSNDTGSIKLGGLQIEQGSYATSYIPTQGSIGTRVAESCSGAGNDQVINSTEGVLYFEGSSFIDSDFKSFSLSDGSVSNGDDNRVMIGFQDSILYANVRVGNVYQFNENLTIPINNNNKIALKYKANDFALWINGNEVKTDNNGTTFSQGVLKKLQFADGRPTTSVFNGNCKDLRVYNKALTDQELQSLTTI